MTKRRQQIITFKMLTPENVSVHHLLIHFLSTVSSFIRIRNNILEYSSDKCWTDCQWNFAMLLICNNTLHHCNRRGYSDQTVRSKQALCLQLDKESGILKASHFSDYRSPPPRHIKKDVAPGSGWHVCTRIDLLFPDLKIGLSWVCRRTKAAILNIRVWQLGSACQDLKEACGKNRPLSYVDTQLNVIT